MRIAIIGAGNVGTTLGRGLQAAGHELIYGVRSRVKEAPHAGARNASIRDAVNAAEAVILATPWGAVPEVLTEAGDFGGRPLLDATNPIGPGFTLVYGHTSSGAEHVASRARNAHVVKCFNSTGVENMADPRYGARRVFMPIAGDDAGAVAIAARLAGDLGFEAVGFDKLSRAREIEPLALLWIRLALALGHGRNIGFALARREGSEAPQPRRAPQPRAITIVGSGHIGGALARAWLRAGHDVRLAVRDADSEEARALVALGARTTPIAGSAEGAEIVVLTVPADAARDVAAQLGDLTGKIVVDCTNALAKGFTLKIGHTSSSAEELARALPGAKVVRSFNQQGAETLVNPRFGDAAATNFVAGDDADARAVVASLAEDVGLHAVDVGPLAASRLLEPLTILWIATAQAIGTRQFGLTLLRR